MTLTPFTLTANPGENRLTLDGVDITRGVRAVSVTVQDREAPQVTILSNASGTIVGTGVVQVVSDPSPGDLMVAVADWLESVDPAALIPLVEARFVSMADNPIALTVAVLAELAREAADG